MSDQTTFDTFALSRAFCLLSTKRGARNPRSLMLIVDLFDWRPGLEYEQHGDGKYWSLVLALPVLSLRLNWSRNR